MKRFFWICLIMATTASANDLRKQYKRTRYLTGNEYAEAKRELLKQEELLPFLKAELKREPDWFASALLGQLTHPEEAAALQQSLRDGISRLPREPKSLFEYVQKTHAAVGSLNLDRASEKEIPALISLLFAAQLEYLEKNPDGLPGAGRLWTALALTKQMPIDKESADRYLRIELSPRKRARVKLDPTPFRAWLVKMQDTVSPTITVAVAQRLMDKRSEKILHMLSDQSGFLGTLAGLLYGARFHEDGRYMFRGEWLETWIKGLDRKRLQQVDHIIAGTPITKEQISPASWQVAHLLHIPTSVAALIIKHRPEHASDRLKSLYAVSTKGDLDGFTDMADVIKRSKPKSKKILIQMAAWRWRSYPCWPQKYAVLLETLRCAPKYDAMATEATTYLSARSADYPSGAELERAYRTQPL